MTAGLVIATLALAQAFSFGRALGKSHQQLKTSKKSAYTGTLRAMFGQTLLLNALTLHLSKD